MAETVRVSSFRPDTRPLLVGTRRLPNESVEKIANSTAVPAVALKSKALVETDTRAVLPSTVRGMAELAENDASAVRKQQL